MKLKRSSIIGIFLILILSGCSVAPQQIDYGTDHCSFCKMTIVETKFGAQIVTKKGKVYKYDAAECLVNDVLNKDESFLAYILVTDYNQPEVLIDATTATFLIDKQIKSPMGANLSSYLTQKEAQEKGENIYTWDSLKERFKK